MNHSKRTPSKKQIASVLIDPASVVTKESIKAYEQGFKDGHANARREAILQVNTPLVSRLHLMDILGISHR